MNYIQQAFKGENKLWMFIITTLCVAGIFILNLLFFLLSDGSIDVVEEQQKLLELIPSKNFWLAMNLLPFLFLLVFLFLFVQFMHKRSLMSLTTTRNKIDWSRVFFTFLMITIFTLITFFISYYSDPSSIILQFDFAKFSILLIVSLLFFPFQIGLEEYLFRGYLMQHIGVLAKNKWFPLIFTSILFGVFHSANPEVVEMGWIVMIFYIGTGLLLGIITLMDEGLELALGFHLGNNLLAALLVTADWSVLQTDAIFRYAAEEASSGSVLETILPVLIVYPIFILILAKKYKWTNWKEKLTGKVEPPILDEDYKIIGEE